MNDDQDPATTAAHLTLRLRAAGCVFAEEEAALLLAETNDPAQLEVLVARRVAGEPLEQVLGWAEFAGLRIALEPGVFVPRRRTQFLVEQALRLVRPADVVLDLCCGSGAIGLAISAAQPTVDLIAADIDTAAVRCAESNVGSRGTVFEGDLYDALPDELRGRIDVIVVNAPYVPTDEIDFMPPEARVYEPPVALDGGGDGLEVQRRVAADAAAWLAPGGCLLIETGARQAPVTAEIFASRGLDPRVIASDDYDATVVVGRSAR